MWPFPRKQAVPDVTRAVLIHALQAEARCAKDEGCRERASLCVRCAMALQMRVESERVQHETNELDLRQ
jgi:hypothetical protein